MFNPPNSVSPVFHFDIVKNIMKTFTINPWLIIEIERNLPLYCKCAVAMNSWCIHTIFKISYTNLSSWYCRHIFTVLWSLITWIWDIMRLSTQYRRDELEIKSFLRIDIKNWKTSIINVINSIQSIYWFLFEIPA